MAAIDPAHVDVERALKDLTPEWQRLTRNHELAVYLEGVQTLLDRSIADQKETAKTTVSDSPLHPSNYTQLRSSSRYSSRNRSGDDLSLPRLLQQSIRRTDFPRGGLPVAVGTLLPKPINTLSRAHDAGGTLLLPAYGKPLLVPGTSHVPEISKLRAVVSNF